MVGAGTYFTYLGFRSGYDLGLVFLAVNVGMLVVVVAAEQMVPCRREWNALKDRQTINDLAHGLIQSQIAERLGGLLFLTVAADTAAGLAALVGRPLWPAQWPLIVQIVLVIAIADGIDYWKHRLLHTVPCLWRFHALHHGITQLHAFRSARNHFTELLMRFLLVYSPLIVIGAPAAIIFWYTSFISILGLVGHSNVRLYVPSVVHPLLMTPQVHWLHHSIDRSVSDTNYANILPIWDILFGSFSHPDSHTLETVGVVDNPIPSSFIGQFMSPFVWNRLAGNT